MISLETETAQISEAREERERKSNKYNSGHICVRQSCLRTDIEPDTYF